MKQKKENRVALLLHWAGGQKIWLFLAILLSMCSGLCIIVPYIGIYRLMDATFNNACTKELVVQTVAMIAAAVTLRFALFGCSGVAAHKGAYGALFKVRCMVAEHHPHYNNSKDQRNQGNQCQRNIDGHQVNKDDYRPNQIAHKVGKIMRQK